MDTTTGNEFPDPDASDETSPASAFPGAGRRVDDDERQEALDAMPDGNAEQGDTVDTSTLDSRAHED